VSLWVNDLDACGRGYLMTNVSTSFAPYAFSVIQKSCATGYYSFGHEMGHNMGAHHDRYATGENGAYTYSHGYVYTPKRWRTIMAYNNECRDQDFDCTRIQYWSNPDISYGGVPTGISSSLYNSSDNRLTLNNTASTVANFRPSCSMTTPPSPDIKANNSDGPVTLSQKNPLSIVVKLNPGDRYGDHADWWIVVMTSFGPYSYDLGNHSWIPGLSTVYQGPLRDIDATEIFNQSGLPTGSFTFYFGVDMNMNGSFDMDKAYYDSVKVEITQ
jgi:hypothetical protein